MLKAAGITVEAGLMEKEAAWDHMGFFLRIREERPMLTLKLASSFDGRIATGSGHSQWITGASARHAVHRMRADHDAVMVGAGTARADDPSLAVRDLGIDWQPSRVVLSRRLDVPLMGQLARTAKDVPVILCHGQDADQTLKKTWEDLGATLLSCATRGAHLDPEDALHGLARLGITRVFCEGGGALAATLLAKGLVDRLIGFTAGLTIGAEGLPSIGALGLGSLDEANRFELTNLRQIGGDVLHEWTRN
jgi:diaminohydroxyphosphoribosylaminopyrimidine deaminase/5-amino-6-(5-phosphoribosylamino)uracil reductase